MSGLSSAPLGGCTGAHGHSCPSRRETYLPQALPGLQQVRGHEGGSGQVAGSQAPHLHLNPLFTLLRPSPSTHTPSPHTVLLRCCFQVWGNEGLSSTSCFLVLKKCHKRKTFSPCVEGFGKPLESAPSLLPRQADSPTGCANGSQMHQWFQGWNTRHSLRGFWFANHSLFYIACDNLPSTHTHTFSQ